MYAIINSYINIYINVYMLTFKLFCRLYCKIQESKKYYLLEGTIFSPLNLWLSITFFKNCLSSCFVL